ncbi:MAG: ABC transporter ATP-binding protein, partial [Acidimicrobiales bacterium]
MPTTTDADESSTGAAIRLIDVNKTFNGTGRPAVGNLSLDLPEGSLTALVGPSGCGKTTTLKMINRLIEPSGGRIEVGGREVHELPAHELRRGIGYVIQQTGLFPHRTIADNIGTVPRLLEWPSARIRERVAELVELMALDPTLLRRYPAELSGGQQQRVGVARALAADPPVLLMDEPYSAVDPIVRAHLQDELLALQERVHKTIVLVTHDIDEAIKLADRVALLNVGGVLEQFGPPEDLLRAPANQFVERFLG